jgi:hypothetical protein
MKNFIDSYYSMLFCESRDWNTIVTEALINFGGKQYPNFGQIVIVSGGSGSGKGFIIDNLFGITGKRYDVDYLKTEVRKNHELRKILSKKFNVDEKVFDMATEEDVKTVHEIMKRSGLKQKYEANIFMTAKNADPDKKPNIIFDKTCGSITDILDIIQTCLACGYEAKNIHLVWVLNDVTTAIQQNKSRDRSVPEIILKTIHSEVAATMKKFLKNFNEWPEQLDGDIYIVFNKRDVDIRSKKLNVGKYSNQPGFFIEDTNYIKIKEAGKNDITIPEEIEERIIKYVPENTWN